VQGRFDADQAEARRLRVGETSAEAYVAELEKFKARQKVEAAKAPRVP
jgi:hypothetical protein